MKYWPLLLVVLLLAACANAPAPAGNGDFVAAEGNDFIAGETAPDAVNAAPRGPLKPANAPLTSEERANAALIVSKLAGAKTESERTDALQALVKLGSRYADYLRSIDNDDLALDLLYVISRIEEPTAAPAAPRVDRPATPPIKREGVAAEDLPDLPAYPDAAADFDREQVEKFMANRLGQARAKLAQGDAKEAESIAQAALVMLPDTRYRTDFEQVLLQSKTQAQAGTLLAGTLNVEPNTIRYAKREKGAKFEKPLTVRCFLKNVSTQEITLRLFEGPGRESVLELSIRYEEQDYLGNVMATEGRVLLPVAARESVTVKPGESYELPVELDGLNSLNADASKKYALGVVTFKAALRIYGANDAEGKPIVLRPVAFPSRVAKILPADFDLPAAKTKPMKELADALAQNRAQDVFMMAHLVDKKQYRVAGDLLAGEDLETCGLALQRARMKALNVLTGTGAAFDAKRWRAWWSENKVKY
ncbi:MAG: hypothetical protein IT462_12355 [Planctomycetes bacterium]|nr:hypothetical protein [Planctomycetota bacterium]